MIPAPAPRDPALATAGAGALRRRPLRILLYCLCTVAAAAALLAIGIASFDWNHARPWLASRIGHALDRPLAIRGDLRVHWTTADRKQPFWQRLLPWPQITAQHIVIGDPNTFSSAPAPSAPQATAEIGQLRFSIDPWRLLQLTVHIPTLELAQVQLRLVRTLDGQVNWTLPPKRAASAWNVVIEQIALGEGTAHWIDAIKRASIKAEIKTSDAPAGSTPTTAQPGYRLRWSLGGTVNKEQVSGEGLAGSLLSLQADSAPFPVKASFSAGQTHLAAEGVLIRPRALAALDLHLSLSGNSLAKLYAISDIVLPETPAYQTAGHLRASFNAQGSDWQYDKFTGKVGSSDLAGSATFHAGLHRSKISGSIVSDKLVFADLAPVIGADSNAKKRQREAAVLQPSNKILPVEPFRVGRWGGMDADVEYTAHAIVRDKALPINQLTTRIRLDNGVLSLLPLDFATAGGTLHSVLTLDGRAADIKARLDTTARHLQLKQLFPAFRPMQASLGELNGDAALSAHGNSIAALLGAANGEIKASVGSGTISKLLLEEIGLNVGNIVLSKLFGDKQVRLHCAASDFVVTDGVMHARTFIIDTDDALLHLTGDINLAQEQLNLTINPGMKSARLLTLRSPLYVKGSFKQAQVGVDKGMLALKAGSALALAVVAPVAAVIPLVNTGENQTSQCAAELQQARRKPTTAAAKHDHPQ